MQEIQGGGFEMNKSARQMRYTLVSVVVLMALVAMFPVSAFACHMYDWIAEADCNGFTLSVKYSESDNVYVDWSVDLYQGTTQLETYSGQGGPVNKSTPWIYEQDWATSLSDSGYRVEVSMTAHRNNGGSLDYSTYDKTMYFDCPCNCLEPIDFDADAAGNPLSAGDVVHDQWLAVWGMHVSSQNNYWHPPVIFDSSNPTCGDTDLGSPNEDFDGPGIGAGGEAGQPGANSQALDKVLIINERPAGQVCPEGDGTADDYNQYGTLTFTFATPTPVWSLQLLDMKSSGGTVEAFDADGNPVILPVAILGLGDNSYQELTINARNVTTLKIHYQFGAVAGIRFCRPGTPTAVGLASFEATAKAQDVALSWETASEVDNLGFNLYRGDAADGPWTQLNAGLIPSLVPPGSPVGATYTYEDGGLQAGMTYYYRLEAVDVYGQSEFYGPVSASLQLAQRSPIRPRLNPGPTK
jgi:hypothetical protein